MPPLAHEGAGLVGALSGSLHALSLCLLQRLGTISLGLGSGARSLSLHCCAISRSRGHLGPLLLLMTLGTCWLLLHGTCSTALQSGQVRVQPSVVVRLPTQEKCV